MLKKIKNIAVVSLSTVGSRVLGLLRDSLIFAALGTGVWHSAFILAFTLPNLFRRLLGEGALTSAVVPIFSAVLVREGRLRAFDFLNQVVLRLALFLVFLAVLGMLLLDSFAQWDYLPARWARGIQLSLLLLPYMIFICLSAIVAAALNLLGRFVVAASSPILLNLSLITAASAGLWLGHGPEATVYWLCGGVLIGGCLQLLLPAWDLYRQGWRASLRMQSHGQMSELWRLFAPGLMGAAILQVNIIVSRLLAYTLDDASVSVLFLASRLMELPLGIFTIAVVTVFFPLLAQTAQRDDSQCFTDDFTQGLRLVVGISLPAGVGLCVLGPQILSSLFEWGAFSAADVSATAPLVAIYGIGLPFYSIATFCTRGLHAKKEMRAPLWVAAICLIVNLLLGVTLMQFLGASGLAAANVIAAVVQSVLLWRALVSRADDIRLAQLLPAYGQILIAGLVMGIFCLLGAYAINCLNLSQKLSAVTTVGLLVPLGALLYFKLLQQFGFEEMKGLKKMLSRS
jgi:putative peptidoglycan lipid II flippase